MALQMLQPGKRALACSADVRARLVGLWWWEVGGRGLGIDHDSRGFEIKNRSSANAQAYQTGDEESSDCTERKGAGLELAVVMLLFGGPTGFVADGRAAGHG
jgi:hypothetical protein